MPAKKKRDARRKAKKYYSKFPARVLANKVKRLQRQYRSAKPGSKIRESTEAVWVNSQKDKLREYKSSK
jgi:hypothetical protein